MDTDSSRAHLQEARTLVKLAATALNADDTERAHRLLARAKELRLPLESLDLLRGVCFLRRGDVDSAREALKEELRLFPAHETARSLLDRIPTPAPHLPDDAEFRALYAAVAASTMVGVERLYALYVHARETCLKGPAGTFVECGVAGGGSSGLVSAVIRRYDANRRLYACDSFSGMPPASVHDVHAGRAAADTGWGAGTCASPESGVVDLCRRLDSLDVLTTVKGYFEDTLPQWKERFGPIAFLHMDGDWYSSTRTILEQLYDSLAPGAYVQVDDYGHWEGCRKAVTEFFHERNILPTLHKIDQTGVFFFVPDAVSAVEA